MKKSQYRKIFLLLFLQISFTFCFFNNFPGSAMADNPKSLLVHSGELYFENSRKGSMWTKTRSRILTSAGEVKHYLAILNNGDFSDWRLPTQQELHDLFMIFDMKDNGDVKIRIEGKYWLTDKNGEVAAGTWEIGDGCGPERHFHDADRGYIRAVRP